MQVLTVTFAFLPDPYIREYGWHGNWPVEPPLCPLPARSAARHLPRTHNHHHHHTRGPSPRPAWHALLPAGRPSQRPSGLPPARSPGGEVHAGPDPSTAPPNGERQRAPRSSPTPSTRRQLGNRRGGDSSCTHVQHTLLPPLPSSHAQTPQHGAVSGEPADLWEHQRT